MKYAYAYMLDTLADWELGYALAELNSGQYFKAGADPILVKTVGANSSPITTKGGLRITPELTPDDINPIHAAVLLLPGADAWHDERHAPIMQKVKALLKQGVLVAGICGGTSALADAGLLDSRQHTSNAPEYLAMTAPNYRGQAFYQTQEVVRDGNLITASAAASLLFAKEILQQLGVFAEDSLEAWYNYYDTGDPKHFFRLMQTLPKHDK